MREHWVCKDVRNHHKELPTRLFVTAKKPRFQLHVLYGGLESRILIILKSSKSLSGVSQVVISQLEYLLEVS